MKEQIDSCLKFSRTSWHYRLVDYIFGRWYFLDNRQVSLCKYFRTVLGCLVLLPFIKLWRSLPNSVQNHEDLGKAISIWAVINTIIHITLWSQDSTLWWIGMTLFFGGLGAGTGVALVILGVWWLHDRIVDRIHQNRYNKMLRGDTKPSLIKEFIKAKKNKVCPCIEFIDEEKKQ